MPDPADFPCLRPLEAIPDESHRRVILRDPTHLAAGALAAGGADLLLLTLLDGTRTRRQVQGDYARATGNLLRSEELDDLLTQLGEAGFLDGPPFAAYSARLHAEYRALPHRPLRDADGFGAPAAELGDYLDAALRTAAPAPGARRLAGFVAPHLDFPRGLPCYAAGYRQAAEHPGPLRVVVLGTNHFGLSRSVVATRQHFQTPLGPVETDTDFLARLEADCGGDLYPHELDHLHEHSIELQAVWLRHVFGDRVRLVGVLCPDPSGPAGTAPGDPGGVDLREFALALGDAARRDAVPTLLVASADLSHMGEYFGDAGPLTEALLARVRESDEAALAHLDANRPEAFRAHMAQTGNPTRVCSVGCLYALFTALGPEAEPRRLRYHQAPTPEQGNLVTCVAYALGV